MAWRTMAEAEFNFELEKYLDSVKVKKKDKRRSFSNFFFGGDSSSNSSSSSSSDAPINLSLDELKSLHKSLLPSSSTSPEISSEQPHPPGDLIQFFFSLSSVKFDLLVDSSTLLSRLIIADFAISSKVGVGVSPTKSLAFSVCSFQVSDSAKQSSVFFYRL